FTTSTPTFYYIVFSDASLAWQLLDFVNHFYGEANYSKPHQRPQGLSQLCAQVDFRFPPA
ncbi:MAG: hypothetical protein ACXWU9_20175, partial [Telluria sp.]